MSALQRPETIPEAAFLAMADASPVKLESLGGVIYGLDETPTEGWIEGVVYAMAGAHPNHTTIPKNFDRAAAGALDARGCRGFDSDQRLKVNELGDYFYPDSTYVCGTPEFEGVALLNPILIVEVLSPSTELRDRKGKMPRYRAIPSVEQVLLIDSTEPTVESQRREAGLWVLEEARGLDASIRVLGHAVRLADVYRFIDFPTR